MIKTAPSIPNTKQIYFLPEDLDDPSVLTAIDASPVETEKKEGKIRRPDVRKSQPD